MDAARAAVNEFMSRAGHHDTTVHERVAPAIYHETITREDHEDTVTVTDREIVQDHYHFTLQPVEDDEVLEDKVEFNMLPIDQRTFEHGDPADVDRVVADEAAKYKTEIVRIDGKKTSSTTAPVVGEHFHHHVHETIQPIVNKRTLEPHVIHTTIPIHEVHHNAAIFHATSSLPTLSMADFKRQGGALNGREERLDSFEGEPRSVGKAIGALGRTSDNRPGSGSSAAPAAAANTSTSDNAAPTPGPSSAAKPSMPDRVTPTKDADADGKKASAVTSDFDTQRVAPPAPVPTTPAAPSSAPPAPPLPLPPRTTTALNTIGHPAIAPTYLGAHLYARRHPAGISGARHVPTTSTPQPPAESKDKPLPERP